MRYFIVELTEEKTSFDEESNTLRLNMQEYLEFVQAAQELDLLDDLLRKIDFQCARCKSFTVPSRFFFRLVFDTIDLDCVYEIMHGLTERVYLTEEEWIRYENYGKESVDILKDEDIVEREGEVYRFIADEIFFRFDVACDCGRILEEL